MPIIKPLNVPTLEMLIGGSTSLIASSFVIARLLSVLPLLPAPCVRIVVASNFYLEEAKNEQ